MEASLNFLLATFLISKRVDLLHVNTFYLTQHNQHVVISAYNQYISLSKSLKSSGHLTL